MAAYAALASLMNNIEQMMKHPHLSNSFNHKQIQNLLEKARFLLEFIEISNYGGGSKEIEDLEARIVRAAHAVEDLIESRIVCLIHAAEDVEKSHIADQILDEEASSIFLLNVEKKIRDMIKKVQHFARRIDQYRVMRQMIKEMDAIVEDASELKQKNPSTEKQPTHSTPPMRSGGDTTMVGLDDELVRLLHELTGHQSSRHTISIVGMGGMGKTTLAKNIYAHPFVMEHFDVRAWVTVSQHYDETNIFSQLLSSLEKSTSGGVGELGERLHKTLIGRRYLVILDDIWSVEAWDKVRHYFPDDGNSGRIILTTRLSNIASACGSSCFAMNLLDEDKSWKLFCEKALFPYKDCPPQLEKVGKEIVSLCKGLALSIVVIGGLLLESPRTVEFWESVLVKIRSNDANSNEKKESLDILSLSYNHLPPHLKPCFLYMGVFKEDSVIRVSTITRLWVAEGFIRSDDTIASEEIAEGFLNDLVNRNLILVRKHRYNGKVGSCGIHDLLRDLCIKVAGQQEFFYVRGYNERSRHRRVVCYSQNYDVHFPLTRSLLISRNFPFMRGTKYNLVRVLSNAERLIASSQMKLYENVNLRYLAYVNPYDTQPTSELPTSLPLIWNLQTLVITEKVHQRSLVVAPSKIWKMSTLRHIKFPKIYLPSEGQDGSFILENLQTLTNVVNLGLSEELCKIISKIKKLSLLYDHELQGYNDSMIECLCNVDRLLRLKSLKMTMRIITLGCEWETPVMNLAFPVSLMKLSLSGCGLGDWDDLRVVGLLPRLQVLNLQALYVKERESSWSPAKGEFRCLKFLNIDDCDLYIWKVSDRWHFPVLEKLLLRCLFFLREIPLDMGEIPTLEFIRVDNCSDSVAISAMRIKEDQLEEDNDALQIEVWISMLDVKRFKKRVEAEQLTLDHIQLEERIM